MSEFVICGIIVAMLFFVVGLMSLNSSGTVAKIFMFGAVGWMIVVSFAVPPTEEYRGCLITYSYDTPEVAVVSTIFWLMLATSIVVFVWRAALNRRAVGKISYKIKSTPEHKTDEYYDDLL